MKITLKGIKTFTGMEGEGFSATLYVDGKKAGDVFDDARGGEMTYRVPDSVFERLLAHAAKVKDDDDESDSKLSPETMAKLKLDCLMAGLVDDIMEERQIKRWCSKSTVFLLKGDEEGRYRTIKAKYEPKVAKHVREKYGDKLVEIVNERFLKASAAK